MAEPLLQRLRAGDAHAFTEIVETWTPAMLRLARNFVSTGASAEEVVQETWLALIRGLDGFEGRSSLRTWTFRILVNKARTRGVREARTVPWSAVTGPRDPGGPTVDPERFRGPADRWPGHRTPGGAPRPWAKPPEDDLLDKEVREVVATALDGLPARQRAVVSLRDVHGLSAGEVCNALELSEANQRVLLHRGRARVRAVLEDYYGEGDAGEGSAGVGA